MRIVVVTKNKQILKILERARELEKLGAQTASQSQSLGGFKNTSHFAGFFYDARFSLSILPTKSNLQEPHIVTLVSHRRKNSMDEKCV